MRLRHIRISIVDRDEFESMSELGLSTGQELPSEQYSTCVIDLDKVTGVWDDNSGKICIHVMGDSWWTDSYTLDDFVKLWGGE